MHCLCTIGRSQGDNFKTAEKQITNFAFLKIWVDSIWFSTFCSIQFSCFYSWSKGMILLYCCSFSMVVDGLSGYLYATVRWSMEEVWFVEPWRARVGPSRTTVGRFEIRTVGGWTKIPRKFSDNNAVKCTNNFAVSHKILNQAYLIKSPEKNYFKICLPQVASSPWNSKSTGKFNFLCTENIGCDQHANLAILNDL